MDPLDVSQCQNRITIGTTGKFSNKNVNAEDAVPNGDKTCCFRFESDMRVARSPASLLFAFPYGTLKSPSIDRVRSIRNNVFSPLRGIDITHWAKGGHYPSEAKISSAYYGSL